MKKKFAIVLVTLLLIGLVSIVHAGNLEGTSVIEWHEELGAARLTSTFSSDDTSARCYRIMIDTWQTGGIFKEPVSSLSLPSGCSIDTSVSNEGWGTKTLTISCDPGLPDGTYDLIDVMMVDAIGNPMVDFTGLQITHWFSIPNTHPATYIWWGGPFVEQEEGVYNALFGGSYPALFILSTNPADEDTDVVLNPSITVQFNEWISESMDDQLTGTITINDGTNDIAFEYSWAYADTLHFGNYASPWLAPDTMYTVTIADFEDLFGNPMSSPFSWTFTTGHDTTPPIVISTDPENGEMKVPVNIGSITITFSEPIVYDPAVGYDEVSLVDSSGNDVPYGWIIYSDNKMGINPVSDPWFDNGEDYSVTLRGSSIKDYSGNEMVDDYQFHFKTVSTDITQPTVYSTVPADGEANVPIDISPIVITFSEPVVMPLDQIELLDPNNNQMVGSVIAISTGIYEFSPESPLACNTQYTIKVSGATDFADNVMEGTYIGHFTTVSCAQAAQDLSVKVDNLELSAPVEAGLMEKLADAQTLIEQKKYTPARKTLLAFINQVKAQTGKGSLTPAMASDLIANAQTIIQSLPPK